MLLGSGLAASNHDTPKLLVSMNDINQLPSLCDIQNGRHSSVNLVAKVPTMVARAWPVRVEVIQDWLLAAPESNEPPSCFYHTSILRYPFDSFKESMDVLLRCSKWLLGAWLDSFTMILRC